MTRQDKTRPDMPWEETWDDMARHDMAWRGAPLESPIEVCVWNDIPIAVAARLSIETPLKFLLRIVLHSPLHSKSHCNSSFFATSYWKLLLKLPFLTKPDWNSYWRYCAEWNSKESFGLFRVSSTPGTGLAGPSAGPWRSCSPPERKAWTQCAGIKLYNVLYNT